MRKKLLKKTVITRDDGKPYMIRRTLLTIGELFSVKLHKIILSDDECLHDHPWAFITVILKGGYYEISDNNGIQKNIWYKPGSILFRSATWVHRLQLKVDEKGNSLPCRTLFFNFKRIREWGFITKSVGWVHWKKYSGQEYC